MFITKIIHWCFPVSLSLFDVENITCIKCYINRCLLKKKKKLDIPMDKFNLDLSLV